MRVASRLAEGLEAVAEGQVDFDLSNVVLEVGFEDPSVSNAYSRIPLQMHVPGT